MKILIIGANGYTGARLYFDLQKDFETIGTYHNNPLTDKFIPLDITDKENVMEVILNKKPDIIVHVANNANNRWCEQNKEKAVLLNEKSSDFLLEAADKIGAKIVYISTQRVKDGSNVYSKTKKNSEAIIRKALAGFIILRPSYILGFSPNTTNDRPFNRLLKNLDEKVPAVYDASWKFQPTYIGHISEIIKSVIKREISNEIIPVIVDELKTRYEVAKDILGPFGLEVKAVDNHDTSLVTMDDLHKLNELNLPTYTYKEMLNKIILEIRNRDKFTL